MSISDYDAAVKWGFPPPGKRPHPDFWGCMTLYFICQRLKPATSAAPENEDPHGEPSRIPLESLDEVMDEEITL